MQRIKRPPEVGDGRLMLCSVFPYSPYSGSYSSNDGRGKGETAGWKDGGREYKMKEGQMRSHVPGQTEYKYKSRCAIGQNQQDVKEGRLGEISIGPHPSIHTIISMIDGWTG
ncbi:hypothetical protein TWF694_003924 [Orbilia ellipsospora]|uniref:Uncharacterized protein n=1 Tax=Orbilia ellipsospora TaxID=2528407 RepID=A0AAV9WXK7_9PEZI